MSFHCGMHFPALFFQLELNRKKVHADAEWNGRRQNLKLNLLELFKLKFQNGLHLLDFFMHNGFRGGYSALMFSQVPAGQPFKSCQRRLYFPYLKSK